jgi:uncharacterized protein (DUF2236 family)
MAVDPGLFGPDSVSWRVQREATVMLGGARALLMHSAHPLVVAGARQTGMYANQPWRRLERTLRQTYTVVFGTREEALAASRRSTTSTAASRGSTRSPGCATTPATRSCCCGCTPGR